ncbi:MAG TPA: ABC transporter ATP-binding protein [Polyangiaceae bacterium]|nr:ABC transporter ATP-binding protein [Polyangiaceae bacterium]
MALSAGLLAQGFAVSSGSPPLGPGFIRGSAETASYFGLGSALVKAAAGAFVAAEEHSLAARVTTRIRRDLVRRLLARRGTAAPPRILAALSVRLRVVELAVSAGVLARIRAVVQLVPLAAALVWLSPGLAGAAAVVVAPFAVGLGALRRRARARTERAQAVLEDLERGVDELVRHADLFRTHGAAGPAEEAMERAAEEARVAGAHVERMRAALSGGNEVLAALAIVGALAIAGRAGFAGESSVLVPFAAVFFMGYRPLRDLGDARGALAKGNLALDAVRGAVGLREAVPAANGENRPHAKRAAERLGLQLAEFGAARGGPRTSVDVLPGELVALVGPTGAGKTTLFRALLGLEEPVGQLVVGGVEVTSAPPGPAERPFAWVPQDAPIVSGTVLANVGLFGGSVEASRDALQLVGAARLAELAEDVGPSGRPLSGGERRLVSLARAFATGLPVLLLDEPTEGLDANSTLAVLEAIVSLRGRRTVIVATHRDDVVRVCERVVTLGAGAGAERRAAE